MARLQPVLTDAETTLVDEVSELTGTKRTDVLKNALAVYQWFVRQRLLGSRIVAQTAAGESITLETPELASLESRGRSLAPEELGVLAKKLAASSSEVEAARLKEQLMRGFYGL